ncbi:MAG TPA: hypothetical protein VIE39_09665 [Thermoanaerobaculia bacterium]
MRAGGLPDPPDLAVPAGQPELRELFGQIAALGIPWIRILQEEIEAERALRQRFAILEDD